MPSLPVNPSCGALVRADRRYGRALALLSGLLLASPSTAANVDGQRFHPATGADDVGVARSAETGGHGTWRAGLSTTYANAPVVSSTAGATRLVEHQGTFEAFASLRWWERFEFGASMPVTIQRTNADIRAGIQAPEGAGQGDLRVFGKARVASFGGFSAALALPVVIGTGRRDAWLGNRAPLVLQPRLILEQRVGAWRVLAEAGPDVLVGGLSPGLGTEFAYAGTALYSLGNTPRPLSVFASLVGGWPLRNTVPSQLEVLGGAAWSINDHLELQAGAGAGVFPGSGTPTARLFALLSWRERHAESVVEPESEPVVVVPPVAPVPENPSKPAEKSPEPKVEPKPVEPPACVEPAAAKPPPWVGDEDADGIESSVDKCPNEAESYDGFTDADGCPEAGAAAGLVEFRREPAMVLKIAVLRAVPFAADSDRLLPEATPLLDQLAAVLKAHAGIRKVRVEGHTDGSGSEKKNANLSLKRAMAVVSALSTRGVAATRVQAVGLGPTRPLADNDTEAGRAKNRRVEFVVVPDAP